MIFKILKFLLFILIISIYATSSSTEKLFRQKRGWLLQADSQEGIKIEILERHIENLKYRIWKKASSVICCKKGETCTITHTHSISFTTTVTKGAKVGLSNILYGLGGEINYSHSTSQGVTTATGYNLQFVGTDEPLLGCRYLSFSPDEAKIFGKARNCKSDYLGRKSGCYDENFEAYVPLKDNNGHAKGTFKLEYTDEAKVVYFFIGLAKVFSSFISLKSKANGKFVCADNFGNLPLIANRNNVGGDWELFELVKNSDQTVSLKSKANNKFVMASNYGWGPVIASGETIQSWEKFHLIHNNDNTISLKAFVNGKYVVAENQGKDSLKANRDNIGDWEKFYMEKH